LVFGVEENDWNEQAERNSRSILRGLAGNISQSLMMLKLRVSEMGVACVGIWWLGWRGERVMAGKIQSPEKELRFTRSGQAVGYWIGAAVMLTVGLTLLACAWYRDINPQLPHPLWAVLPVLLAVVFARLAARLTRHAYLILTPLGIEVFPFFRPAQTMNLISWQELADAEVDGDFTRLTLHHNVERTSGVHLSLRPIRADRRELLAKAVMGRLSRGGE
jgi:hypothetical protein